jgi:hypothetical protein
MWNYFIRQCLIKCPFASIYVGFSFCKLLHTDLSNVPANTATVNIWFEGSSRLLIWSQLFKTIKGQSDTSFDTLGFPLVFVISKLIWNILLHLAKKVLFTTKIPISFSILIQTNYFEPSLQWKFFSDLVDLSCTSISAAADPVNFTVNVTNDNYRLHIHTSTLI